MSAPRATSRPSGRPSVVVVNGRKRIAHPPLECRERCMDGTNSASTGRAASMRGKGERRGGRRSSCDTGDPAADVAEFVRRAELEFERRRVRSPRPPRKPPGTPRCTVRAACVVDGDAAPQPSVRPRSAPITSTLHAAAVPSRAAPTAAAASIPPEQPRAARVPNRSSVAAAATARRQRVAASTDEPRIVAAADGDRALASLERAMSDLCATRDGLLRAAQLGKANEALPADTSWAAQQARRAALLRSSSDLVASTAEPEGVVAGCGGEGADAASRERDVATRRATAQDRFVANCSVIRAVPIGRAMHRAVEQQVALLCSDELRQLGHDKLCARLRRERREQHRQAAERHRRRSSTSNGNVPPQRTRNLVRTIEACTARHAAELRHLHAAEASVARWQSRATRISDGAVAMRGGGDAMRPLTSAWSVLLIALFLAPRRWLQERENQRRALASLSCPQLVQLFRRRIVEVVLRMRRRRARAGHVALAAAAAFIMLLRRVQRRSGAAALILATLRRAVRRRPTAFYVHRFRVRVVRCQRAVRARAAMRAAQWTWSLALWARVEHADKGRHLLEDAAFSVPPPPAGKTPEWDAERCACAASRHFSVPWRLKVAAIRQLLTQCHERSLRPTTATSPHQQQQRQQRQQQQLLAAPRSGGRVILPLRDVSCAYRNARRWHEEELRGMWLHLRRSHVHLRHKELSTAFAQQLRHAQRGDEAREWQLVFAWGGGWVHECHPRLDVFERVTAPMLAITFYRTLLASFPRVAPTAGLTS